MVTRDDVSKPRSNLIEESEGSCGGSRRISATVEYPQSAFTRSFFGQLPPLSGDMNTVQSTRAVVESAPTATRDLPAAQRAMPPLHSGPGSAPIAVPLRHVRPSCER